MPAASGEPGGRYTGRAGMCLEELEEKTMETGQKPQVLASWRVIVAKELRQATASAYRTAARLMRS